MTIIIITSFIEGQQTEGFCLISAFSDLFRQTKNLNSCWPRHYPILSQQLHLLSPREFQFSPDIESILRHSCCLYIYIVNHKVINEYWVYTDGVRDIIYIFFLSEQQGLDQRISPPQIDQLTFSVFKEKVEVEAKVHVYPFLQVDFILPAHRRKECYELSDVDMYIWNADSAELPTIPLFINGSQRYATKNRDDGNRRIQDICILF